MRILDTTLREGDQMYGAYLSPSTRRSVLQGLWDMGVDEIELGCAGQEGLAELVSFALAEGPERVVHWVWTPCREDNVRAAVALGARNIHMGVPVSEKHARLRLGLDMRGVLDRVAVVCAAAREAGAERISIGLEDASGAWEGGPEAADAALERVARHVAAQEGVCRIRLADTRGRWTPLEAADAVRRLAAIVVPLGLEVGVHCHNDLGMATANAVTALMSGAAIADGSVLGIGERSGVALLEELAAWIASRESGRYQLGAVGRLCRLVGAAAGVPVSRAKPVAGRDIFACESGIHVHGMAKDPGLFEPYAPEMVGGRRTVGVGRKSGRAAVLMAVERLGGAQAAQAARRNRSLDRAVRSVRELASRESRALTDQELTRILTDSGLIATTAVR